MKVRISTVDVDEGELLYDDNSLILGDIVVLEQPQIEETVHVKMGFWSAFARLSESDAETISMLMIGYKYKDIAVTVNNARYRIKIARKRFKKELLKEGVNV